ncbi:MAG: prolipoprotein diacylglyceryl transferase [Paludibacteraceae bacterium]|nr:prolipoprotein diacylglyceryl transferase [Paludibacteraceae bacterium]
MLNLYIIWDFSGKLGEIEDFSVNCYGLLFAAGLALSGMWVYRKFLEEGMTEKDFEIFMIWGFVCMFLGCRLGHCFFYQWGYYSKHLLEILLPFKITAEGWRFIGYRGLASHGGAVGMFVAEMIFWWRTRLDVWKVMDIVAIGACLAGGFIRLGNLMNSEIVGLPTDLPWGFVFTAVDDVPRHPAQLYESLFYFVEFGVAAWLYGKFRYKGKIRAGGYFGAVVSVMFTFRILIEKVKEVQESFENEMVLDMGQILSIPFIIVGAVIFLLKILPKKERK